MGKRREELSERIKAKVAEVEVEIREMLYGEAGCPPWGTKFAEIEKVAMAVGEELSRRVMSAAAGLQQKELSPEALVCEGESAEIVGAEKRCLETKAGPIEYETPKAYLPKSRRAFFPSGEGLGNEH
jgi:hypothetical protein